MKSEIGTLAGYAYVTPFDNVHHMAFVHGRIGDGEDVLARLHRPNIIRDVFGGANPIHAVLRRFKAEGRGVLVYLRDGAAGVPTARDSAGRRDQFGSRALAAMARDRARRADPEGPRHLLDPADHLAQADAMSGWPASASRSRTRCRWRGSGYFFSSSSVPSLRMAGVSFSANLASSHGSVTSSCTVSSNTSMVPWATWPSERTRKCHAVAAPGFLLDRKQMAEIRARIAEPGFEPVRGLLLAETVGDRDDQGFRHVQLSDVCEAYSPWLRR